MADKLEGSAIVANTVSGDRIVTGSITTTQLAPSVANFVNEGKPLKIRTITYPGNDTAANTGGSQTIVLTGSGFKQNVQVYINSNAVPSVTYANANSISFTSPALAAATYPIYVINTDDGATAILIPGIQYSGTPTWSTTTPLTTQDASVAWNIQLVATSDSTVSYSLQAGSSLPAGITLAANGLISGTMSSPPENETTYNFTVVANDLENQDASRAFSVSVTVSVLDPYFTYTTLLLHGDGTNNANNHAFVDSSTNNFAITRNGNATQGSFSPFGDNWSVYLDGNGDYLRANLNAVNIRTAHTIEGWFYTSTITGFCVFSGSGTAGVAGGAYYLNESAGTIYLGDGESNNLTFSGNLIPLNQWFHIAITFDGTTYKVFINGNLVGSSTTLLNNNTLNGIDIGGRLSGVTIYTTGYISNFRVLKGTALYTSAFTSPTQPLTPVSNTSLLTCQSNAFVDKGPNRFAITRNGDTRVSKFDPFKPYKAIPGSYGVYFDGTGDYLTAPSNSAFSLGTGDFTIEYWVYKFSAVNQIILDARSGITASPWVVAIDGSNFPYLYDGSTYTSTVAITNNSWTHVVIARSSGTLRMFVNGVQGYSNSYTANLDRNAGIFIGARVSDAAGPFNGHISNLRIIKGTAVYTSAFTPPTSPLTAIANTQLLTCQSTTIVDNSTNAFTITRNGDARPTDLNPFTTVFVSEKYNTANGGGAAYFDGSGDYLTAPSNTALAFGTSDFTVEAWVYRNSSGSVTHFVDFRGSNNNGSNPVFYFQTNNYLYYTNDNSSGDNQIQTSNPVIAGVWTHIALVRSGTTLTAYINGVASGSTTYSTNVLGGNVTTIANRFNDSGAFNGYISNLRILKGTATYTNNFVPPAGPVTNTANTSLLCNFTNAGIIDSVGKNVLETVGDAKVNTSIKKFGTGSMYFDGNGDVLIGNPSQFTNYINGTGDWTYEFWIYYNALPTGGTYGASIYAQDDGAGVVSPFNIVQQGNTWKLWADTGAGSWDIFNNTTLATTSLTTSTWYHIAFVRTSGTLRMFVDGTQVASTALTASIQTNTTRKLWLFGTWQNNPSNAGGINGYVDDVRLTKGIARYRYNFTPPTKAFNDGDGNLATLTSDVLVGDQVNTPVFPYTTLLLPGNGTNNQNNHTFLDSSNNNFAITRNGNATQGTFSPFSQTGWSMYQSDINGNFPAFTTSVGSAFQFTGDFTIEAWVYPVTYSGTGDTSLWVTSSDNVNYFALNYATSNYNIYLNSGSPTSSFAHSIATNQWNHVAMVRSGSTITLYTNGVAMGTLSSSATLGYATPSLARMGGGVPSNVRYVSNLRIVKGTAVYTANFTPPTAPLTAVANTQLLTCQSNRFVDNSNNNFTATLTGSLPIQAFSPFPPSVEYTANTHGGSAYFDGTGDYLETTSSQIIPSGNFTIEAWAYITSSSATQTIVAQGTGVGDGARTWMGIENSSGAKWAVQVGGTQAISSVTPVLNTWHHLAMVYNGSTIKMFLNGTEIASAASTTNASNTTMRIGTNWGSYITTGYISNIRISNTNRTINTTPSSLLSADGNTVFLANYTNAGITDATGKNVLETVGDAKISTAQSKFGGSSMYFDGTGDWLVLPPNPPNNLTPFGTGDFTVEFWVRFSSFYNYITIVSSTRGANGFNCGSQAAAQIVWYANGAERVRGTTAMSANTWYHIAFVRYSGTLKGYLNGVQDGTTYADSINYSTPIIRVGNLDTGGEVFTGYLQDLRITRGIARYTQNFTPPTTAFLLK